MTDNRIAFLTDQHLLDKNVEKKGVSTLSNWQKILEDVRTRGIKTVVLGGDLGEMVALPKVFKELADFTVFIMLGNHDKISVIAPYFSAAKDKEELYYTADFSGYRFIFMDSSSAKVSKNQQDFLKKELAEAEKPVLFIHHPVLKVNTWMEKNYPLKNKDEIKEVLDASGKKITVFSGHYHLAHNSSAGSLTQIISPAISYQILENEKYAADTKTFGYLIADFGSDEIQTEKIIFN